MHYDLGYINPCTPLQSKMESDLLQDIIVFPCKPVIARSMLLPKCIQHAPLSVPNYLAFESPITYNTSCYLHLPTVLFIPAPLRSSGLVVL